MRLPRDVSGTALQTSLRRLGYERVFHKSPLKSQAVDGATIYDISLAINTDTAPNPVIPVKTGI